MPIPLRTDYGAIGVRAAARKSKHGAQARRLLALAAIYEGASRTGAARVGGGTLQIIRDWVVKFNAAGSDGLIDRKAPGQSSHLQAIYRAALATPFSDAGNLHVQAGPHRRSHPRGAAIPRLGLNLVIAASVYWNSTYIGDVVLHLRAIGEDVPDELLAHTSPVGWGYIAFSGDFPVGPRRRDAGRAVTARYRTMSLAA